MFRTMTSEIEEKLILTTIVINKKIIIQENLQKKKEDKQCIKYSKKDVFKN